MAIIYPKFDQKINNLIQDSKLQESKTRPGTIVEFDKMSNTATVILDEKFGGTVGDIVNRVPCPFTYGIQGVSPHPGTRCVVAFRSDSERDPYIVSIIADGFDTVKTIRNNSVNTGIPKFMI
jgi:hypothetical protein